MLLIKVLEVLPILGTINEEIEQVKTITCWRANKLFHGIIIKPIISVFTCSITLLSN